MGKISLLFFCKGGSVSMEVDNLENMDWMIEQMEKRGFIMWPGILPDTDPKGNDRELADDQDWPVESKPVDFCPLHGDKKKWEDAKDGGHYCGEKVDGKWCGYKENMYGVMTKPPKTMPDYVQF